MATDPVFATTPNPGTPAVLGSAETSLTVPTNSSTIITAGSNGTIVPQIVVEAVTTSLTPTTVAGLVYLFLYDGTTYTLYDTITVSAVTASATTAPFRQNKPQSMVLKSGWSIKASQSISGNASLLKVMALDAMDA